MKKTNKIMLIVLLASAAIFFVSEWVAGWFEWERGKEYAIGPYTVAYVVGLLTAVIGVPMALVGLGRSRGYGRAAVVAGLNCLCSLAFIWFLFVWPVIKYNIIGRSEPTMEQQKAK